jgi:16S rRNA (cytosine1402-N4)-methyltransferase
MNEIKTHTSVLFDECLEALSLDNGKTIIDGTFGAGGHSLGIAKKIGKKGTLISFDQDAEVFQKPVVEEIKKLTNFIPVVANFRDMEKEVEGIGINEIDGVLLDLGLSSTQLEHSGRGFSFQRDEPLHMTFSDKPEEQLITAEVIINEWEEGNIADILYGFAEETFSRKIAKAIVEARQKSRITTTGQLVDIIKSSVPGWYQRGRTNPATRTFQALRMAVNDEMGSTEDGIRGAHNLLKKGGKLAVISFHSIEDRLVKNTLKKIYESSGGKILTKKPIIATEEETKENPRSRSAKLRIIEK